MIQAGLWRVPDLDETASALWAFPAPGSWCQPWAAATWGGGRFLGIQDGRPPAELLSQSLSFKKIPGDA